MLKTHPRFRALLLFSTLLLISHFFTLQGLAWGANGHRITGAIADSYLQKKAKKRIQAILGTENLAMASTWADFIKSDSLYKSYDVWHYINIPGNLSNEEALSFLKNEKMPNAYQKINWLSARLKDKSLNIDSARFYLRMLIHLVGDVHQPMHVGRVEDLGGNRVRILWFGQSSNLHRLWDDQLISHVNMSYSEYTNWINHTDKNARKRLMAQSVEEWMLKSYERANFLYANIQQYPLAPLAGPNSGGNNSSSGSGRGNSNNSELPNLSYRYHYDHVELLNTCLVEGGIHLAGLLNTIFQ